MRSTTSFATSILVLALLATSCTADYIARTGGVRRAYERYEHERAVEELDERVGRSGRRAEEASHPDALLYLMDRGMILHSAGELEESNEALHRAESVAAALDIVSVSEEAGSLATTSRRRAYRGEAFELLLINVIKALNFAALGDADSALVEVRRAHERLRVMEGDESKAHHELAIARYVAAVLWEWAGELDSAFIDYSRALRNVGEPGHLVEPLLRLARETGRQDEYERLRGRFPDLAHDPLEPGEGQLVLVVSAGLSPVKKPTVRERELDLLALPYYQRRSWSRGRARMRLGESEVRAVPLTSVERVAARHLEERIGRLVGRGVAGAVVKAGVATAVGAATRSEDLGLLTLNLLLASNRPDLRSWLSLPAEFQVARARLPAGRHVVEIHWDGKIAREEVTVRAGEMTILPLRRY